MTTLTEDELVAVKFLLVVGFIVVPVVLYIIWGFVKALWNFTSNLTKLVSKSANESDDKS